MSEDTRSVDSRSDETEVARSPHGGSPGGSQVEQRFADPGLPAHVHRRSDTDPRAARRAARQVAGLFTLSIVGTLIFVVAYIAIPLNSEEDIRWSRLWLGLGLGVALFCIGAGAIHWAKTLMPDDERIEERHAIASSEEDRAAAAEVFREAGAGTGFGRRKLIWGSLTGALGALVLPAVVSLRDLWVRGEGDSPTEQLKSTLWAEGVRLVTDPTGHPVRPEDIPIGAVVHVLPEGLAGESLEEALEADPNLHPLDEIAKAAVLVMRLEPDELNLDAQGQEYAYNGIVAYSKICTHVGCPIALYEQTTHHLLCPCHQSTFDVANGARVIFGPAKRPLPQLPITLDADGYLVAQSDFTEPVGPSFWGRER